jgi:pyrimidine-nucleoside phosphorylase
MMRPADLIERKRDDGILTADEIRALIGGYVAGEIPDYQIAAFLMAVFFRGLDASETAALTEAMVASGATLDLGPLAARAVDKHSSGGVGDKLSLVVVPLVASAGVPVPKLSGRGLGHTGGTLDKLESIAGFRTALSEAEFAAQVDRVGCAIAGQSASLVPADAKLYALRDVTATVDSIPLIAASIMSKKLAIGARGILLDVKCGRGAFMKTLDAARALARTMVDIGRAADRRVVAAVTQMEHPLGRAVGNALEVREAIEALRGRGPADLEALCLELAGWMLVLGGAAPEADRGRALVAEKLRDGSGLAKFREMVVAQGGDASAIDDPDRLPQAPIRRRVPAPRSGFVTAVDAAGVGLAAMRLGAGRAKKGDTIDAAVGVVVDRPVGGEVQAGDSLATIHARTEEAARRLQADVAGAFTIAGAPPPAQPLVLDVITAI